MTDSPIVQALMARAIRPGTSADFGGRQDMPPGGVGAMPRVTHPMTAAMLTHEPMPPGGVGPIPRVVRQGTSGLFGGPRQVAGY